MALTGAEKQRNYRQRKKKAFLPMVTYLPRELDKSHRAAIRRMIRGYLDKL